MIMMKKAFAVLFSSLLLHGPVHHVADGGTTISNGDIEAAPGQVLDDLVLDSDNDVELADHAGNEDVLTRDLTGARKKNPRPNRKNNHKKGNWWRIIYDGIVCPPGTEKAPFKGKKTHRELGENNMRGLGGQGGGKGGGKWPPKPTPDWIAIYCVSPTPSASPSDAPSATPSDVPSATPSDYPSWTPSASPSDEPSASPSDQPSEEPSNPPTTSPVKSEPKWCGGKKKGCGKNNKGLKACKRGCRRKGGWKRRSGWKIKQCIRKCNRNKW
jgi:hypothetical protein